MQEEIIILQSGKCSWGRCFACGWGRFEKDVSIRRLKEYIDKKFSRMEKVGRLKIFASGSFLDDKQFPRMFRKYLVKKCNEKKIKELAIESRPEFINDKNLKDFSGLKLVVSIGLEIADNKILKKYNKGFAVEDYIKAAEILKKNNCGLRTYLMVGLPFVKDLKKGLKDSVDFAEKYSKEIVLINVFPHSAAPIFDLWIKGKWKPLDKKEFDALVKEFKYEKDFSNFAFVPRFPNEKQVWIKGASKRELLHPYFEVWQDYFSRIYEIPRGKDIVLFTMCAFKKPYSSSRFFKSLLPVLRKSKKWNRIHIVVVSSPGVVPFDFSNYYPFNKYDWPEWKETKAVKRLYLNATEKRALNYLENHKYKKYYCYLKPCSESYKAVHIACKKLNIKLIDCISKETYRMVKNEQNPLSREEGLEELKKIMR